MKDIQNSSLSIETKKLLDWYEGLAYAFHDVDLNYEDEEAREQVKGVFSEMGDFLKQSGVDISGEMESRNAVVVCA